MEKLAPIAIPPDRQKAYDFINRNPSMPQSERLLKFAAEQNAQLIELLEAYRNKRKVDGGNVPTPRVWDAQEHYKWSLEVERLESKFGRGRIKTDDNLNPNPR
ncbi:MAG TPA: hypothetical protein VHV32_19480 [Candidatus Angelobacter sp.]|jgi:hypothetical protein|nr:hypothetical protein [Candidatus Angelobacter sp.]